MLSRLRRAGKQPETLGPWGVTVLHHGSVSWCPGQQWWDWGEAAGTYGCIHIIYVFIYIYIIYIYVCVYIYIYTHIYIYIVNGRELCSAETAMVHLSNLPESKYPLISHNPKDQLAQCTVLFSAEGSKV